MNKINKLGVLFLLAAISFPAFSQEDLQFTLKHEVKTTPVKNQSRSGTCWAFAGISFVETELLRMEKKEYDLSEMQIVRNIYPVKANNYIRMHGNANFSPGGQAHDVINAIKDYGFLPESIYPGLNYGKDYHDHGELDDYLKLLTKEALNKKKKSKSSMAEELINATLNEYLGPLPDEFNYRGKKYTAKTFYQSLSFDPKNYIELTSYTNYPFYSFCVLQVPDNWSYDPYFNLPLAELMESIDYALENGYSVCWDGDVSGGFDRIKGIAILADENTIVNQANRQKAFDNFESTDDHLMHLTGIAYDQNGKKYYLTKNSWGVESVFNGYWYMSEQYVRLNTVAVMIHRDSLPSKISKKILN